MGELTGHVAIISGGLGDIGRQCALELARRGADIAVGDWRDDGSADPLRSEVENLGRRFRCELLDVADAEAVQRWVAATQQVLGPADLIIPAAAIVEIVPVQELTIEAWNRVLAINLTGAMNLAHAAAQRLIALRWPGRIVFVGSWAAHAPHAHIPAYCVAKAGLRMLCKCMALEYARYGILVNEVAPGFVDAGLSKQVFDQQPELRSRSAAKVPVRELMTAEEVALHVAHLCDPRHRNMTGSTLLCDGGLSLVTATWKGLDGP